jgi:adenosylcobinamide-phosphate synthase
LPGSVRGLLLGYALDLCLGDPRRRHPVAVYGAAAAALETRVYADGRSRGVAYWCVCVGLPVGAAALASRDTSPRSIGGSLSTAVATWAVLGGRSLVREGHALAAALERAGPAPTGAAPTGADGTGLDEARARLPALCGRDPSALGRDALARAGVESMAENTSDAVVGPLLWGALLGVPGLVGYRAVNTLDAMVGNRSARYHRFGWAAARADDLANLLPARLTALLTCAAAPLVGGRPANAWATWRRDARRHPSPNAGHCEAAAAGALGVRLGGTNVYADGAEARPELGDGRTPTPHDVRRAARLSATVGVLGLGAAAVVAAVVAAVPGRRR